MGRKTEVKLEGLQKEMLDTQKKEADERETKGDIKGKDNLKKKAALDNASEMKLAVEQLEAKDPQLKKQIENEEEEMRKQQDVQTANVKRDLDDQTIRLKEELDNQRASQSRETKELES